MTRYENGSRQQRNDSRGNNPPRLCLRENESERTGEWVIEGGLLLPGAQWKTGAGKCETRSRTIEKIGSEMEDDVKKKETSNRHINHL